MTDLGVDGVGEVHGRRALRQADRLALRCEDEDVLGIDREAEAVEELARILGFRLPGQQLTQVGHLVDVRGIAVVAALGLLIAPVRGDPVLGRMVHLVRADLDLQRLPLGTHDGGV